MSRNYLSRVKDALQWPQRLQFLRGYLVVAGAIVVHLTLGSVYTFGNLLPYMVSYIRHRSHPQDLSPTTGVWIYALAMVGHGVSMFFGGWLERRIGPRLSTLIGSGLLSLGVVLSFLTIKVSFWLLLLTYGFLFGLGMGIAYVGPLASSMRWMPRWKGVTAGFVLAGFGLGALIFDPIQTAYINPHNQHADTNGYFDDSDLLDRVPYIFLILGSIYVAMQFLGAMLIVNPPEEKDTVVENSKEEEAAEDKQHPMLRAERFFKNTGGSDCSADRNSKHKTTPDILGKGASSADRPPQSPSEVLSPVKEAREAEDSFSSQDEVSRLLPRELNIQKTTPGSNSSNSSAAKMKTLQKTSEFESSTSSAASFRSDSSRNVVVSLHPFQMLKKFNFYHLWVMMLLSGFSVIFTASLYKLFGFSFISDDHFLAIVGATSSICNCAGRIVWGLVADVVSYKFALVFQSGIMTAFLLTFFATSAVGKPLFFIWVCVIFFCLGGVFSLYPTAIARSFGPKYLGMNYGLLFTSQTSAGVVAVVLFSTLQKFLGWYGLIFLISGFSLSGFVFTLLFRSKRYVSLDLGVR